MDMKTIGLLVALGVVGPGQLLGLTLPNQQAAEAARGATFEAQEVATSQAEQITKLQKMLTECQVERTACFERCN